MAPQILQLIQVLFQLVVTLVLLVLAQLQTQLLKEMKQSIFDYVQVPPPVQFKIQQYLHLLILQQLLVEEEAEV